jgi:hypothetical protein
LDSLSPEKRERISKKRQWTKWFDHFEFAYKQFIIKTKNKEIIEMPHSVQFIKAWKELYKKELELPENIRIKHWFKFDKQAVTPLVFKKNNPRYVYLQELIEHLNQEWKYIATKKSAFDAIMDTLEWSDERKLLTIAYFTEYSDRAVASMEEDEDHRFSFVGFWRQWEFKKYKNSNMEAVIYAAKDC